MTDLLVAYTVTNVHVCVHICLCVHVCVHICLCVRTYACVCMCVC